MLKSAFNADTKKAIATYITAQSDLYGSCYQTGQIIRFETMLEHIRPEKKDPQRAKQQIKPKQESGERI
jgi:hypothetical protein